MSKIQDSQQHLTAKDVYYSITVGYKVTEKDMILLGADEEWREKTIALLANYSADSDKQMLEDLNEIKGSPEKLNEIASKYLSKVETSSKPLEVKTSSKPLEVKTSSKPLEVETSSKPLEVKTSSKPLEVETSSKPLEVETPPKSWWNSLMDYAEYMDINFEKLIFLERSPAPPKDGAPTNEPRPAKNDPTRLAETKNKKER